MTLVTGGSVQAEKASLAGPSIKSLRKRELFALMRQIEEIKSYITRHYSHGLLFWYSFSMFGF
jgi:hypothetical protein